MLRGGAELARLIAVAAEVRGWQPDGAAGADGGATGAAAESTDRRLTGCISIQP
jgi:hypothetical protein